MGKKKGEHTFEEALAELERHVEQLETGDLGLDKALTTYEKGLKALRECQGILAQAEKRIEVLTRLDESGQPVTEPFAEGETEDSADGDDEEPD